MAISYDALPSTRPSNTLPKGFYKATILNAEMKTSKTTHNDYLSLTYDLRDANGNGGKLYDMQFDSEKEFLRYKLGRFLTALNLNLQGSFELKDLCKLVKGKQLIVDITIEEAKDGNPERNVINSFEHEIYYNISEWASLTGAADNQSNAPVINARDAIDAVVEDAPLTTRAAEEY
jgi:hypothetical protein